MCLYNDDCIMMKNYKVLLQTEEDIIGYSACHLTCTRSEIRQPNTEYYILGVVFWLIQ